MRLNQKAIKVKGICHCRYGTIKIPIQRLSVHFVCLLGDVTITGKVVLFSTFSRHSWPWSSEGSVECHSYCITGHPFIILWTSPRNCDTHTCCRAFGSGAVTTCFNDLVLSRTRFEHSIFCMRGERSHLPCQLGILQGSNPTTNHVVCVSLSTHGLSYEQDIKIFVLDTESYKERWERWGGP